jgi:hypothetical protein
MRYNELIGIFTAVALMVLLAITVIDPLPFLAALKGLTR